MTKAHFWQLISPLALLAVLSTSAHAIETASPLRGNITGGVGHEMPIWFKESFLDITADVEEATEQNKHVLLFFHLNECPYCDRMLNENFRSGPIRDQIAKDFDVIAINIKGDREIEFNEDLAFSEKALATQLKVRYTPTMLFLNADNEAVARLNGYRAQDQFKKILQYVSSSSYQTQALSSYLAQQNITDSDYALRTHPLFKEISNLSAVSGPLAVIFEDKACRKQCNEVHDTILNSDEVKHEMSAFTVVRLDADSNQTIIDPQGKQTTPKNWAAKLKLNYRPGVVLFTNGKEITRIDGLLYSFHYKEVFRYVSGGYYKDYASYTDYLAPRQEELLSRGVNIDLSK